MSFEKFLVPARIFSNIPREFTALKNAKWTHHNGKDRATECWPISPEYTSSWWRHKMETFSALLALCVGISPVRWIPAQRPVTLSFGVFYDLRLNKRLSIQSGGWWFETPSGPLWRHSNDLALISELRGVVDNMLANTMRSRYIAVIFLWRTAKRHPIARP